jgi:Xaa-Pro dipeptidase
MPADQIDSEEALPPGTHPHFDAEEFAGRIGRLRARLRAAEVDLALFDEIEAMTWVSGFGNTLNRWRCVGIPVDAEPFFLIRALDATPCRQRSWITDVRRSATGKTRCRCWKPHSRSAVSPAAGSASDFGSYAMPLSRFAQLRKALPFAQFVDLGPIVSELRLAKSPAEIGLLTRAAGVADEAMQRAAAACVRGASQRDAGADRRLHVCRAGRRSRAAGADHRRAAAGTSCTAIWAKRRWPTATSSTSS